MAHVWHGASVTRLMPTEESVELLHLVREIADRAGSIGVSAFAQRAHRPLCSGSFSDERFVDANAASTTSTHEVTSCSFSFITLLLLCRCPESDRLRGLTYTGRSGRRAACDNNARNTHRAPREAAEI